MATEDDTLQTLLNKATNPLNRAEDWELIIAFCDKVNDELEGPQVATRLITHKIQSPQENEALLALSILESCVKNCGQRFHNEIGKFRFLNELIKLVSPKYLAGRTSDGVQKRVVEILYSWSIGLPSETKIKEAYDMLKTQGIVKEDPTYIDHSLTSRPMKPRPQNPVFDDEEKNKLLTRLLGSKHAEDLEAANKLIKNMVKEDSDRMERANQRVMDLETIDNNVKLLNEVLAQFNSSSAMEKELVIELYQSIQKLRPRLFTIASDTEETGEILQSVLEISDRVNLSIEDCQIIIPELQGTKYQYSNADGSPKRLIELINDSPTHIELPNMQPSTSETATPTPAVSEAIKTATTSASLLEKELASLGLQDVPPALPPRAPLAPPTHGTRNHFAQSPGQPTPAPHATNVHQLINTNRWRNSASEDMVLLSSQTPMFPPNLNNTPASQPAPNKMAAMQPLIAQMPACAPGNGMGTHGPPVMGQGGMGAFITPQQPTAPTLPHPQALNKPSAPTLPVKQDSMAELDLLGKSWLQSTPRGLPATSIKSTELSSQQQLSSQFANQPVSLTLSQSSSSSTSLLDMDNVTMTTDPHTAQHDGVGTATVGNRFDQDVAMLHHDPQPAAAAPPVAPVPNTDQISLTDVFVPLQAIQPSNLPPVTVFDQSNLKVVLYVGLNSPQPGVMVMVLSLMSTYTEPLRNVIFQAAVPKTMKVKLQPPSGKELPAHNPFTPASAITQVMLLANPTHDKVRMRYKISYTLNDNTQTHVGDIDNFPTMPNL